MAKVRDAARTKALGVNFRDRLRRLGMTNKEFSDITGISLHSINHWTAESYAAPPTRHAWRVLALIEKHPETIELLRGITLEDEAGSNSRVPNPRCERCDGKGWFWAAKFPPVHEVCFCKEGC